MKKINLAIIFGGRSVEHDISIISALQAIENINKDKYNVFPIYVVNDFLYHNKLLADLDFIKGYKSNPNDLDKIIILKSGSNSSYFFHSGKRIDIDLFFPIVHGTNIEDGTMSAYLNFINVPFIGSNHIAAGIAQDKIFTKQILSQNKIDNVPFVWFYKDEYIKDSKNIIKNIETLKYPVIIKPATLGSSIGIKIVDNKSQLIDSLDEVIKFDDRVLVEKAINNFIELNIAVLGDHTEIQTSQIERVNATDEILSFEDKYMSDEDSKISQGMLSLSREIPARIEKTIENEIIRIAKETFRSLNLSGVSRIDFIVKNKKIYVNEINSIPGSLSFYLFENKFTYSELLDRLIEIGKRNTLTRRNKNFEFISNVLDSKKINKK